MSNKVLVALDNSAYADKVMLQAIDIAKGTGGILFGLGVIEDSYVVFPDEDDPAAIATYDFWKTSFMDVLTKCQKLAEENGVYFKMEINKGNAAEEILKYADAEQIDLIVLGNLGKNAGAGFPIGSVAQKVASHSKCSVFIVK